MKTYVDCLPCFFSQALNAARMVSEEEELHERVLREVASMVASMDMRRTPPEMGAEIHRVIRRASGDTDPYLHLRERYTSLALDLLPELRERVRSSDDPFDTALRICIAGNVIDFGANLTLQEADVIRTIDECLLEPVEGVPTARVRPLFDASSILWVGDNAGEIVLDRLVLELLDLQRITYVVRGAPIINDATLDDARASGITEMVRVITTGCDAPGAPPAACGGEFLQALENADLVVAKGQGNYETLGEVQRPIVFMLRAKCPVIARDIGVPMGSTVIDVRNLRDL